MSDLKKIEWAVADPLATDNELERHVEADRAEAASESTAYPSERSHEKPYRHQPNVRRLVSAAY